MRILWPFLALYRRHWILLTLGILLSVITLLASIGLLTLSGWFLAGTAIAGIPGAQTFNYLLPAAGVRGRSRDGWVVEDDIGPAAPAAGTIGLRRRRA